MKKVYIVRTQAGLIEKIFSNPKSADRYMNYIMVNDETLFHELFEPEEFEVEP